MFKQHVITPQGLKKIKKQIKELEQVIIPKILEKLKTAHADGDLRENNPYIQAKEDLSVAKHKLAQLKEILRTAKVVDTKDQKHIVIGTQVLIEINGIKKQIILTSSIEADPLNNKISVESPIGKALLGKKAGDVAEVQIAGNSTQRIKILEIKN